jgi:hypothetical protein
LIDELRQAQPVHKDQHEEQAKDECRGTLSRLAGGEAAPTAPHRLGSRWRNEDAKEETEDQATNMRRVVNAASYNARAETKEKIHQDQPADLTEGCANAALNEWAVRPLCAERHTEEGEDATRSSNRWRERRPDRTRERCGDHAKEIPEEESLRTVESLYESRAEIHGKEIKDQMQRTPVDKRNRKESPRLNGEQISTRRVNLDQRERLKECR